MTLSEVKNKINSILRESTMNEAGISRMYTVFLGVQSKVKNQEAELKSLLVKWKSEKDDKKRASIQSDMKNKTKTLKKTRANLSDIEANYINKMSYDDSYSESVNEGKFKKDDLVYNKRTKTVGIVRLGDDKSGEVKTDADGNVDVDELEKYNPIKNKHQNNAKVAPSTEKEVSKRGLFNPFKNESVNEGKKRFKRQDGIGKAKYTISYHDGKKKHKDGSDFFDIKIFKNKKDLSDFVGTLAKQGYKLTNESVNEGISVSDERHFGKKGIIIMIDDNGKKVSAIFKDKKNADKFNRNKSSDIQKLLQLAKKTKYPKAIDESLNEVKEHDVITQLRKIVKDNQNALVVDTKSKKKVRVDMQSASLMVQVYDAIKQQSNKDKFVNSGIVQMGKFSWKILNK